MDSVYAFLTSAYAAAMYKASSFNVRPGSAAEIEKIYSTQAREVLQPVLLRAGGGVTKRMFEVMLTAPQKLVHIIILYIHSTFLTFSFVDDYLVDMLSQLQAFSQAAGQPQMFNEWIQQGLMTVPDCILTVGEKERAYAEMVIFFLWF